MDRLVRGEAAAHLEAEGLREEGGVAEGRVGVEREVSAVDGDVVREQRLQPVVHGSGDRGEPAPEEPVVHQEEVRPGGMRHLDCAL